VSGGDGSGVTSPVKQPGPTTGRNRHIGQRTFAAAVAASPSSAGTPPCPDRCRHPVGRLAGSTAVNSSRAAMARDVFDVDCGQDGGAAVLVYPRSSQRIRPARAGTSRAGSTSPACAITSLTATSIPPMESCSHTLRGLTNPRGPRPSDSSIILLLIPVMTVDAYAAQAADTAVAVVRCSGPAVTARNDRRLHSAFIVGGRWPAPKGLRCQRCTSARSCGSLS
jgi:hypothetical protein